MIKELYRICLKDNNDKKLYVKAITFGGEPFTGIIPAFTDNDAAMFEKDKADAYKKTLEKELADNKNLKIELEKIKVDVIL